ncbi:MAG: hypothetical protein SF187_15780 [Deltaproteobacteria bacterium]|nr:hypothetical protein [Deltaproteobacteria bacterium]
MSLRREELLENYRETAGQCLLAAGDSLARRQFMTGPLRGSVARWEGEDTEDFHGTLASVWLWSRAQLVSGEARFGLNVGAAWHFIEGAWDRLVPASLSEEASDEAVFDCALVLRAGLATFSLTRSGDWRRYADRAARLLAAYLGDLEDKTLRGFSDPGFAVWQLADYARATGDRGLLSAVARFVDRTWSTKVAPNFKNEPQVTDDLFDFVSTAATSTLALMAAEGETPFVGSWLRERVAPHFPATFTSRAQDENSWNACVAAAAGRAYVISHDDRYLACHQDITKELMHRAQLTGGAPGRALGFGAETLPTFFYGVALDSLVVGR